ncbi:hypothetical protein D3C81_816880 [compost metagenome]
MPVQPLPDVGLLEALVVPGQLLFRVLRMKGGQQRLAEHLHHGEQAQVLVRRTPKGGQAQRLLVERQFMQMHMQGIDERREIPGDGGGVPAHVLADVQPVREAADLLGALVAHLAFAHVQPLVQQVVKLVDLAMQPGRREGRRGMADGHAPPAALDLQRFADVVDDVGIDDRRIAHHQVGIVVHRQAAFLAGLPFVGAVGAQVHQRVAGGRLPGPQVGGQVAVRRRHLGVVVQGLFPVVQALATRRLRQQDDIAQAQARHGEPSLVALTDQQPGLLRRPPALLDRAPQLFRQAGEPGLVAFQRQPLGQIAGQQVRQCAIAVIRREQGRQLLDQRLLVAGLDLVSLLLECRQQGFQAARDVEEGRAEVLLPRRIVVIEHRHLLLGVRRPLQVDQRQRLAHQPTHLLVDADDVAIGFAGVGGNQRIDHAGILRLRQVERDVLGFQHHRVGLPVRLLALAVGHGLQHGQAQALELGLAPFAVEHDLGVDQHAVQRLAVRRQHPGDFAVGHGRHVERQGQRAGLLDPPQRVVDESGQSGIQVALVEQHGDHRRRRVRVDPLPAQVVRDVSEYPPGVVRVIDARLRIAHGFHTIRRALVEHLAVELAEESGEVGRAAMVIVLVHVRGHRCSDPARLGSIRLDPQPGLAHLRQQWREDSLGGAEGRAVGGVDDQKVVLRQFSRRQRGAGLVDEAVLHDDPLLPGQVDHPLVLPGLQWRRAQEQHALRRMDRHTGQQQQPDEPRHQPPQHPQQLPSLSTQNGRRPHDRRPGNKPQKLMSTAR